MCYLDDLVTLERLRYNLVGGLLPFGMGVLVARFSRKAESGVWKVEREKWKVERGKRKEKCSDRRYCRMSILLPLSTFLLPLLLAIPMTFSPQMWLWVPALAVVGTIGLVKLIPQRVMPYVVWLGTISAAIFVMHPLVRKIFVRPYFVYDQYAGLLLFIVVTLVVSWLVKKIIDKIPKPTL